MPKANDGFPVMRGDIFQCCGYFAGNNLKPSNWFILHPKISELEHGGRHQLTTCTVVVQFLSLSKISKGT